MWWRRASSSPAMISNSNSSKHEKTINFLGDCSHGDDFLWVGGVAVRRKRRSMRPSHLRNHSRLPSLRCNRPSIRPPSSSRRAITPKPRGRWPQSCPGDLSPICRSERTACLSNCHQVGLALQQIHQSIATNPKLDTKEMYELRKKMFEAVHSGPRF